MPLLVLLAAPSLMLLLGAVERRHGAAVAGWLGAAPMTIAVVVLGAGAEGAQIAAHAGAHVVAQVAFFVAFAAGLTRRGPRSGVLAGTAAFAAVSLPVAGAGLELATAAAVPALLAGSLLAPRSRARAAATGAVAAPALAPPGAAARVHPAVSAAAAFLLVGATLAAGRLAGPAAAGTIAAFPALSTALALVVARNRGSLAAAAALHGAIGGLRGYLAFCVTTPALGPAAGLAACLLVFLAGRRHVPRVDQRRATPLPLDCWAERWARRSAG